MSIQVIEGQTYNFSFGYFKGEAITWTLNYSFSYGSASPDDITYTPIQATFSGGNTPISFSITQDTKAEGTETAFLKLSGLYWSNEFPQNKYSYSYDQEISIKDDDIVCNVDFNGDGTIETFEGSAAQLSHKLQGIRIRLDGISDQTSYLNEALDGLNSANIYRNIEFVAKITSSLASITADVLTLGGASEARAGLALAKDLIDAANNSADFFKSINDQGKDVYDKLFGTLSFSLQSTKLFADQYSKFFHILPVAGDVLSGGAEINSYLNDLRAISADVKGIKTKIDDLSEKKINLEQALDTVYQCLDEASSSAKLSLSSAKFAQASIISEKTIFADSSLAAFKVGADINVISNGDSVFVSGSVFGDHLKAEDLGSYKQSLIMLSDGDDTYTTSQSVDKFETILGGNGYDIVHTDLKSSEIVHLANNEWIVFNNDQAKLHIEGVEELYVNGKSLILSGIDAIEAISSQVSTSNDVKIGIFNDTNPDDGIVFSRTVSGANSEFMYFKGNELYLKAAAKLPLDSELTEVNISVQGSDGTNYQEKFNAQIKPSDTAAFKSLTDMSDNVSYNTEKSAVFILALSGNDSITGSKFDDILNGGEGNDLLRGGAGNDIIIGGSGYDRMMGGSGNDTFVFSKGDLVDPLKTSGQMDHIIDFHAAGDNSSVEKDNLKFTGFGDGKLIFDHNLGNNPYTQIYKLISEDGNYQGSILVQMADTTKQLSSSDYMFA